MAISKINGTSDLIQPNEAISIPIDLDVPYRVVDIYISPSESLLCTIKYEMSFDNGSTYKAVDEKIFTSSPPPVINIHPNPQRTFYCKTRLTIQNDDSTTFTVDYLIIYER